MSEILKECSILHEEHRHRVEFPIQQLNFQILVGWFVPKIFISYVLVENFVDIIIKS